MPHQAGHSGEFFDFLDRLKLSDLASTGVNLTAYNDLLKRLGNVGSGLAEGARTIGTEAAADTKFEPFTVTTGFGTTKATDEGGYTTTLTPEQTARQAALSGITGGLLGDFTGLAPDVSAFQSGALSGAESALTAATGDQATREADVYERIRAAQRPEEERQRLALQEQLQSQGRTGLRTAMFGGSPEQFALEKARAEAQNTASLAAIQQAGAERQQDLAAAQGMFGLGQQAAGLPAALQAAQLQNIGAGLGLEYAPEQQLLSTLTPAATLSNLVGLGARQGAGLLAETQMSGLEDIIQAELAKNQSLSQIYGSLLGAGGQAASGQGTANIFDQILGGQTLGGLFSSIFD